LYVLEGAVKLAGPNYQLTIVRSPDAITSPIDELRAAISRNTALVALTQTSFKSGYTHDMQAVTQMVHRSGALMLWDLCHSVGVMPIDLQGTEVDLAVGCTYKYLNGGPGAPAFLYVRKELQNQLINPIWGWFGQHAQFNFRLEYEPAPGINRFQTGTPPILSLLAMEGGIDVVIEAGIDRIRHKSVGQTDYLIACWTEHLEPLGVALKSPRDAVWRGSHVSFGHPDGFRIAQALIEEMHVIPDFRHPDNIRFGISPLYTTYTEIHQAVQLLKRVIVERRYERYSVDLAGVT
jgi:kynureninase